MSLGWLLGRKKSKKERLRETLAENKARGRAAERQFVLGQEIWGNKVARSPKGQDYIVKEYDMWTGRYKTVRIEVRKRQTVQAPARDEEETPPQLQNQKSRSDILLTDHSSVPGASEDCILSPANQIRVNGH